MSSTAGRRLRLAPQARREAILVAARTAFARRAYDRVGVVDVATTAGTSEALLYRYFHSKAELYASVVAADTGALLAQRDAVLAALGPAPSPREAVRATLLVYLSDPAGWVSGVPTEPREAAAVRQHARAAWREGLTRLLERTGERRRDYALDGFFGFVESVSAVWRAAGRPTDEVPDVVAVCLGALEGALAAPGR